jgi:hypothetical protein
MNDALPTTMVGGYEEHIRGVTLPDPNDRHVVAAGIAAKASFISPGICGTFQRTS